MILPPSVCHSLKFVRSFGKVNDTEDKNIDLNNTVTIWIFRRKIRNIRDQFFLTHENYENNKFNFWYLSLLQFSARLYSSVCRVAIMNISKTVQPPFDSQKFMYGGKNPGTARGEKSADWGPLCRVATPPCHTFLFADVAQKTE